MGRGGTVAISGCVVREEGRGRGGILRVVVLETWFLSLVDRAIVLNQRDPVAAWEDKFVFLRLELYLEMRN